MTRFKSSFIAVFALCMMLSAAPLRAQEMMRPCQNDRVTLELAAEDWVTTKTARVVINVEAAVSASNEGSMRADMFKAVDEVAKADWRLTAFDRSQDQTGLERWSTSFEARVPESELGGLGEKVKKLGKAGMQLSVAGIDFSPTLEEMEAARAALRVQIYKQAGEQLAAVNAAFPSRDYRIAQIDFTDRGIVPPPPMPRPMMARAMVMTVGAPGEAPESSEERSEKVTLAAHVVFAAAPEKTAAGAKR